MIRFVLVNGSYDSVVPICVRVVGMYMLVKASELTPCVGVNWNCSAVVR
jgi:hypothetical protein